MHSSPYQEELKRPVLVTTGLVACPTLASGNEILSRVNVEMSWQWWRTTTFCRQS